MIKRFIIPIELAALAIVLAVVGGVIQNQSAFAVNTVHSQLAAQGIHFQAVPDLLPDQKQQPCLVENANRLLTTAAQAECFANYQIGLDLPEVDHGKTYYQASLPVRQLEVKMAILAAKDPKSPELPKLEALYGQLEAPASALFQGNSLRGMLLTTYGFAHLGQLGEEAATVLFVLAGISVLGALALAALKARDKQMLRLDVVEGPDVAIASVRHASLSSAR
jgi:hypothetical protein